MQHIVACGLERVKLLAILGQFGTEISYALIGLVLFGWVEFLLGERVVLVNGLLKRGQGGRERAEGRGAEDGGGGGGWVGRVGGRGGCEGLRGEVGEVSADRGALFQSTVECCVLLRVVSFCCDAWVQGRRSYHGVYSKLCSYESSKVCDKESGLGS